MRTILIAALTVLVLASGAEARKKAAGSGTSLNCGPGCSPLNGTVCMELASKAADGSYLAIAPSTPVYIGHRVVPKSVVVLTKVSVCWVIQQ